MAYEIARPRQPGGYREGEAEGEQVAVGARGDAQVVAVDSYSEDGLMKEEMKQLSSVGMQTKPGRRACIRSMADPVRLWSSVRAWTS